MDSSTNETVYIQQRKEFVFENSKSFAYRLNEVHYELRHASQKSYAHLNKIL